MQKMYTTNPFTPMSFFMLDVTLEEAEEMLGRSALLTPEQKKTTLEEYRVLLAEKTPILEMNTQSEKIRLQA